MVATLELIESFRRLVPLAETGDRAAASDLLGALIERDRRRQDAAARALHTVRSERFWRLVVEFLATGRWYGRRLTRPLNEVWRLKLRQHLHALVCRRHDPAADAARTCALIASLGHQSLHVRAVAADLLGEQRAEQAAGPLIEALDDPAPAVRIHAARALGRLERAEAVRPLLGALAHRVDALAGAAVDALVQIGRPALPDLIRACDSPDEWVRWHAARALGRIRDPATISPLVRLLGDVDAAVRWAAVRALPPHGQSAAEAVISSLLERAMTPVLADAAGHVLRQIKDPRLAAALRPLADHLRDSYAAISVPPIAERVLVELHAEPALAVRPHPRPPLPTLGEGAGGEGL